MRGADVLANPRYAGSSPSGSAFGVTSQQAQRDALDAGRLLAYGLTGGASRARSVANDPDLVDLVQQYHSSAAFREVVKAVAAGLRLQVVEVDAKGVVLMAMTDSPFALDPGKLRNYSKADDRLLDGLMQIAIAATVFPRPATLDDDPALARPPISAEDVEHTLRDLCDRLAAEAQHDGDPTLSDVRAGLIEAWRVYQRRPAVRKTTDDRKASRMTLTMIGRNLETLREYGCFIRTARLSDDETELVQYQPTWRYQVQMQDFTASELFGLVTTMLQGDPPKVRSAETPAVDVSDVLVAPDRAADDEDED